MTQHVIIIEDESLSRRLAQRAVSEVFPDAAIATMASISEIEQYLEDYPDREAALLLLDMMLPDGTGDQAWELLKDRCSNASVIVLSALVSEAIDALRDALPFDHFLTKPLDFEEATALLRTLPGSTPA